MAIGTAIVATAKRRARSACRVIPVNKDEVVEEKAPGAKVVKARPPPPKAVTQRCPSVRLPQPNRCRVVRVADAAVAFTASVYRRRRQNLKQSRRQ